MSMTPFVGIPGKLKTLLDRLTSTRATNLDNLNATVSSRAPASSALSSATWTGTRAAKLDNLDNLDASVNAGRFVQKFQLFTASGTWTKPAKMRGTTVLVTAIGGGGGGVNASFSGKCRGGEGGQAVQRIPYTVAGNTTVVVGAGGSRTTTSNTEAGSGGDSSFGSLVAKGGRGGRSVSFLTATPSYGPRGGIFISATEYLLPEGHGGPFGGQPGPVTDFGVSSYVCSGGGGLLLGNTTVGGEQAGGQQNGARGIGYGGGAVSINSSTLQAQTIGVNGAVLVEWWEEP